MCSSVADGGYWCEAVDLVEKYGGVTARAL